MKNNLFVIDTNTLISAFLFKESNPRKAFDKATETGKISASPDTFREFAEVLLRPKFDKYISAERRLLVLYEFKKLLIFNEVLETITDCRDPKDNKFLELAIAANASCIITGDKDLLMLHPFRGVPILNAVDFVNNF
jgi:putative PIN family toxin of toxin-antitoxin system